MKKWLLYLFAAAIIASWGSANAYAQAWFNPGWNYRSDVTISNGGSALTDYQVQITLARHSILQMQRATGATYGLRQQMA